MKNDTISPLLREKLLCTVLYEIYAQSFGVITGYQLELQDVPRQDRVSVAVRCGKILIGYLVAEPIEPKGTFPLRGLLESFALQLGDEANRAVLATNSAQPQSVKDAIAFLKERLCEKVSLDEVADHVQICSFQLCRLFKKHTGITMTEYVNRLRVEQARKRLVDPGRQIAEVAHEVGFSSLSQFNRNFLKIAGESPSEYRETMKQLEHCQLEAV